jgi:outer membrane protein
VVRIFNQKRDEYYYKEKQFNEDNQSLLMQHNEQVNKQINQYIEEFGKEKGYKYIYGATGNGSMMYADKEADISKEVISYINDKYTGIN